MFFFLRGERNWEKMKHTMSHVGFFIIVQVFLLDLWPVWF